MNKVEWITIFLMILFGYDELTENISRLSETSGLPLIFLSKLAILVLLVYLSLKFLLKRFNEYKKIRYDKSMQFDPVPTNKQKENALKE